MAPLRALLSGHNIVHGQETTTIVSLPSNAAREKQPKAVFSGNLPISISLRLVSNPISVGMDPFRVLDSGYDIVHGQETTTIVSIPGYTEIDIDTTLLVYIDLRISKVSRRVIRPISLGMGPIRAFVPWKNIVHGPPERTNINCEATKLEAKDMITSRSRRDFLKVVLATYQATNL
jgi:hypothetical protein